MNESKKNAVSSLQQLYTGAIHKYVRSEVGKGV